MADRGGWQRGMHVSNIDPCPVAKPISYVIVWQLPTRFLLPALPGPPAPRGHHPRSLGCRAQSFRRGTMFILSNPCNVNDANGGPLLLTGPGKHASLKHAQHPSIMLVQARKDPTTP